MSSEGATSVFYTFSAEQLMTQALVLGEKNANAEVLYKYIF